MPAGHDRWKCQVPWELWAHSLFLLELGHSPPPPIFALSLISTSSAYGASMDLIFHFWVLLKGIVSSQHSFKSKYSSCIQRKKYGQVKAGNSECEMKDFTEPWLFRTEGMLGISEVQCSQTPFYTEKFLTLKFLLEPVIIYWVNEWMNEWMNEQARICGGRLSR